MSAFWIGVIVGVYVNILGRVMGATFPHILLGSALSGGFVAWLVHHG